MVTIHYYHIITPLTFIDFNPQLTHIVLTIVKIAVNRFSIAIINFKL